MKPHTKDKSDQTPRNVPRRETKLLSPRQLHIRRNRNNIPNAKSVKAKLRTTQEVCLRGMLGAYRTTPNETLGVLAKDPPFHLKLSQIQATFELKKIGLTEFRGQTIRTTKFEY